mgnify:CR=1 FL=1
MISTARRPDAARPPVEPAWDGEKSTAAQELLDELARWQTALETLLQVAGDKLAALRQADTAALHHCAVREGELLHALFRDGPRRQAALARAAQGLHAAGPPTGWLTQVAEQAPEPWASRLRARTAGLRELAGELQRRNKLVAHVARQLQSHIRGVFAELAGAAQESTVYGPQGQQEHSHPRCWVDAVG